MPEMLHGKTGKSIMTIKFSLQKKFITVQHCLIPYIDNISESTSEQF